MRLGILPFCWAFLVVLAAPPVPSAGEISQDAYARVNTALVTAHVLPRYARLSGATGSFADAVKTLCDCVDEAGTAQAREDFHLVMDAWMAVQHLKIRPHRVELPLISVPFLASGAWKGHTGSACVSGSGR